MNPVYSFALRFAARCQAAATRHPRRLASSALAILGTFAVTAFGIAPLAPDAATLPQRLISETLEVPGLGFQSAQLAEHPLTLYRSNVTRGNETADSLLGRLGVADPAAAAFLRQDREARRLFDGQAGKWVQARSAADGSLIELVARFAALDSARAATHFTRLKVARSNGRFISALETAALVPQVRMGSGTVHSSLWAATDAARLPEVIAGQLIDIFSADIDFHRQLGRGDSFSVLFETLTADDQVITWGNSTGRILAAEFINKGTTLQAHWFHPAGQTKGAYYSPDGRNRQRLFLASPLEFSRVTSGFAMRMHPILNHWRAHNGVDYSAPTGTPVQAVGEGVVEYTGRQAGYGNLVRLLHQDGKSTVYAHLSRIDVRPGMRVEQGQRLGAVGSSGWATGPHLHFELRINGQFQDPLQLAADQGSEKLDAAAQSQFIRHATLVQQQLAVAHSVLSFRADAE